jgi:diguanylate cyclase (GGDEF)-like protein
MPKQTLNVLLVEDNPGDASLFKTVLAECQAPKFEIIHLESLAEALAHLVKHAPDVAVLDLGLPDAHGMDAVQKIRGQTPSVPIVVLTSVEDESLGMATVKHGAQDYLVKGQLDARLLMRTLLYAIERHRIQTALETESVIDELTGIHNRRGFLALANQHLKLAQRTGEPFLAVFVDLDGLKQINDTFGHQGGDDAIREAVSLLQTCIRKSDILGRLGGDELAILMANAAENTGHVLRLRLHGKLATYNASSGRPYKLSVSIGSVRCTGEKTHTIEELLEQADALMYEDKQKRKNAIKEATPAA